MPKLSPDERRALIEHHLKIAYHLANRFRGLGMDGDDLDQVAVLALCQSARRFEPGKLSADEFGTFASRHILTELRRAVQKEIRAKGIEIAMDAAFDPPAPQIDSKAQEADDAVRFAMRFLTHRQRDVLRDSFGLDGRKPLTLPELAAKHNTSVANLKRILASARDIIGSVIREQGWSEVFDGDEVGSPTKPRPRAKIG